MSAILNAVLVIGVMGLLLGAGLAAASKVFAVEKDPRIDEVKEVLPGANCGGCGLPGCDAMAEAIVTGKSPVNGCPVGGAAVAAKVAAIMGMEAGETERQVAFVSCKGCKEDCTYKYEYYGEKDCQEAMVAMGGDKTCEYGCLGYGSCVKACKFDAIHINEKGLAEVDPDKCTSCGACIAVCPKNVIRLVPESGKVFVSCNSHDKGKEVKVNCKVGCIACGICVKNCPFEAITIEEGTNLPKIDYSKCRSCMICVEKCPQKSITSTLEKRKKVVINEEKCVKCGICKKNCPKEAIEGEVKQPHKVLEDKCIGCGICAEKCPKDAITME